MIHRFQISLTPVLVATFVASACLADDAEPKTPETPQLTIPATNATVEKIMERAVQNIARRYNLNKSQTEFTSKMMTERVNKFLLEHEDEVWPVIRDLLAAQLGASPPTDEEALKQLGKTAGPLAKLAEEAILQAQEDWRPILTEDQKKMHDFDLEDMKRQFKEINGRLDQWAEGNPEPGPIFGAEKQGKSPEIPPRPREIDLADPPPPERGPPIPTLFDTFVEEFIRDYHLDKSQIDTARSILKEFKSKASDVKEARKVDFARLAEEQKKAIADKDRAKLKETEAAYKKLLEPVYDLFSQMEERLKGLLTTAQIQRHAAAKKREEAQRRRQAPKGRESEAPSAKQPPQAQKPPESEKTTSSEKVEPAEKPAPAKPEGQRNPDKG